HLFHLVPVLTDIFGVAIAPAVIDEFFGARFLRPNGGTPQGEAQHTPDTPSGCLQIIKPLRPHHNYIVYRRPTIPPASMPAVPPPSADPAPSDSRRSAIPACVAGRAWADSR